MKVFKFGGASIKSAKAVANMAEIVKQYTNEQVIVVVSAMGKTTNRLEAIYHAFSTDQPFDEQLEGLKKDHLDILAKLLGSRETNVLKEVLKSLDQALTKPYSNYDFGYDQVIAHGELLASTIIHSYLQQSIPSLSFLDARDVIRTNDNYRNAAVDWQETESLIQQIPSDHQLITQGFIASDRNGHTTTLGREGSDFTGAIFASLLDAESLTVWKDVPGILNADPKLVDNTTLFKDISYEEAAEMTYYGAKVIHPKTIKPLANKGIPLLVRPFLKPDESGTAIRNVHIQKPIPTIIFKENQTLLSFGIDDFTFINEAHLTEILHTLTQLDISLNLMQNSAISFSICIDHDTNKLEELLAQLNDRYAIKYNENLRLITVKNYDEATIQQVIGDNEILLEQRTRHNFQLVTKA